MAAAASPHRDGRTSINLTTSEPRPHALTTSRGPSLGKPFVPHLTLHQFRKQQLSPVPASPPDLDYKRVRRKPSFTSSTQDTSSSTSTPLIVTSSTHEAPLSSLEPLLPSLLPPSPLTPTPRQAVYSPSLSSTVDTLPSTPSYTPLQHQEPAFGRWWSTEGVQPSEPVRAKRKLSLKQAKRLPHPVVREVGSGIGSGSGIWQVHAAIIDLPNDEDDRVRNLDHGVSVPVGHVTTDRIDRRADIAPHCNAPLAFDEKRGRSVRFKEEANHGWENGKRSLNQQSSEGPLTSSYTLSKFKFPAPPGHHWTGTFGHLTEPTPPTSPATLHYKGTSFDLLNPHASLLLGPQEFETPAEIDGLLDDYFDAREMSDPSLPPSDGSSRRGRQLYDTPNAARREILRLQDERRGREMSVPASSTSQDQRSLYRSSSVYPHSQRSNPFDLTLSDSDPEETEHARLEPESTVTNIVGCYQYDDSGNPFDGSDDGFVDVDLNDNRRPSSIEIFRGLGTDDLNEEDPSSFGNVNIDPDSPRILRRHRLPNVSVSQPPRMRAPALPSTARRNDDPLRFTNELTDLPTSDQTYGNTGQLLDLSSPTRAHSSDSRPLPSSELPPNNDGQAVGLADESFPELYRCGPREPEPRTLLGQPSSSSLSERLLTGGNISPTPASRLDRSATAANLGDNNDVNEWESDHTNWSDIVRQSLESPANRQSMDSYANTSTAPSQHRLSYPQQPPPAVSRLFAYRAQLEVNTAATSSYTRPQAGGTSPQRSVSPTVIDVAHDDQLPEVENRAPVLPTAQEAIEAGDEALAIKILEDRLLQASILGSMGRKDSREDKAAKRADAKLLEELRLRNPSSVRTAVKKAMDNVGARVRSPLENFFAFPSPAPAQSPNTASDTESLLQNAATPPTNTRPMIFSPTMNSFTTSPDEATTGSQRSPDG